MAESSSATQFGHYDIERRLGGGGMGDVYLAVDRRMGRKVALKILKRKVAAKKDHVQRFMREVKSVARLEHPNVIKVYEVGEEGGNHFFAMEYVEGLPMNRALKREGHDLRWIATLFRDIALGLDHAHGRGVVHRDIKLSNILLSKDGVPKIVDFGLAREIGGSDLTATGQILGTPAYMAPEQVRGDKDRIGPRSDIYSLGAILYVALTGQAPYTGENSIQILKGVLSGRFTPPRKLNPAVPRMLERICLKAMSLEPDARYPSAAAMAADLARFAEGRFRFALPRLRMRIRFNLGFWAQAACYGFLALSAGLIAAGQYGLSGTEKELARLALANDRLAALRSELDADPDQRAAEEARAADASARRLLAAGRPLLGMAELARADSLLPSPAEPSTSARAARVQFATALLAGRVFDVPASSGAVLDLAAAGESWLALREEGGVRFLDLASGEGNLVRAATAPGRFVSPGPGRWFAADTRGTLLVSEGSGSPSWTPEWAAGKGISALAVAPERDRVAVAFSAGGLAVSDPAGKLLGEWTLPAPVAAMSMGPGGRLYLASGPDVAELATTAPGAIPRPLWKAPAGGVRTLAASPTGAALAVLLEGGELRILDPRDPVRPAGPAPDRPILATDAPTAGITFHPSGALLAAAGKDGKVRLWLLPEGIELSAVEMARTELSGVEFVLEGTCLAAGSAGGLHLFPLTAGRSP
ncbi:MAG: protein kinase [Planctomycetes bacterium]|nr:protein kinase [Planctomycetota bacterium]